MPMKIYTMVGTHLTAILDNAMTSSKMAIKNRISEIDNLSDNWDGYNAVAPSHKVITNSYKFIDCVLAEGYDALTPEDIVPTPYGSIVMDFSSCRGIVSVEIGTSEIGFFTEFINNEDFILDGINTDFRAIPENLKQAFNILYAEQG